MDVLWGFGQSWWPHVQEDIIHTVHTEGSCAVSQNVKQILVTEVDSGKDNIFLFNRDPISACEDRIKATAGGKGAAQLSPRAVHLASVIGRARPRHIRSLHQGDTNVCRYECCLRIRE